MLSVENLMIILIAAIVLSISADLIFLTFQFRRMRQCMEEIVVVFKEGK